MAVSNFYRIFYIPTRPTLYPIGIIGNYVGQQIVIKLIIIIICRYVVYLCSIKNIN